MLERLPDEISILILAHCKVAELGRAARAWRDLNNRDGVWRALQKAIHASKGAPHLQQCMQQQMAELVAC